MHNIVLITSRLFFRRLPVLSFLFPVMLFSQNSGSISNWIDGFRNAAEFRPVRLFHATPPDQASDLPVDHPTILMPDEDAIDRLLHRAESTVSFLIPQQDSEPLTLEMARVELLAPGFSVGTKGDEPSEQAPWHAGVHYRGIVRGNPNSIAAISITSSGVSGMVVDDSGTHELGLLEDGSNRYIYYLKDDLTAFKPWTCSSDEQSLSGTSDDNQLAEDRGVGCKTVNIYFECDYKLYLDKGSSVVNVTNYVTSLFNQISALYANENVGVAISQIYVWTSSDPYAGQSNIGNLLNAFRQNTGTAFNGNLAHFLSTRSLGGGIAYVDVICFKQYAFGVSCISNSFQNVPTYSWSVEVVTHELGHNVGSWHTQSCNWANGPIDNCVSPEGSCAPGPPPVNGGTIMSYCHLTNYGINFNNGFGPQPGARIRERVQNATCINSSGTAPSGLTAGNITGTSATLSWLPVAGAVNYTVQYKLASSGNWTTGGTTTATTLVLNNLSSNSNYQWQVKTDCSGFSTTSSFTTGTGGGSGNCNAPGNLFAANITTYSAQLSWASVAGASDYTVQFKTSSSSTWLTAGSTAATSYNLVSLNSGTTYNWRVKANCSAYSAAMTFTTGNSGGGITCVTPSNLTNTAVYPTSASISWSPSPGATSYTLQIKLASSSTYATLGTVPVTAVTMSGLQSGTSYHWRVKANCSNYSDPKLLTTPPGFQGGNGSELPVEPSIIWGDALNTVIYPNPARDFVYVALPDDTPAPTRATLLNTSGQQVSEQLIGDDIEAIDVSKLPAGIYFLKIWQGELCLHTGRIAVTR